MKKVISFKRDGEYMLGRASANRAQGRLLEALKLLRRVVEVDPGNVSGWMEMAQTLCEMGCFEQSNRVLALMMSVPGAPSDCYFGMCCNFMGLGDYRAAFGAVMNLIAFDPQALSREDVAQTFGNVLRMRIEQAYKIKENRRVDALRERADELLRAGRTKTGLYLAEKAYELDSEDFAAERTYARALVDAGDIQKARKVIDKATEPEDCDADTFIEAIRINTLLGEVDKAHCYVGMLMSSDHPDEDEMLMCFKAACALGDDVTVSATAAKALRFFPFSTEVLHICAVNRVKLGRPIDQAVSFWTRANSVDPDDVVIRYYLKAAQSGQLPENMPYKKELPPCEAERLCSLLKKALIYSDDELDRLLGSAGDLRDACQWAIFSTDARAALARPLLERSGDAWAKRVLSESRAENFRRSFRSMKFGKPTTVSRLGNGCALVPPRHVRAVRLAGRAFPEYFNGKNMLRLYEALAPATKFESLDGCVDSLALASALAYTAIKAAGGDASVEDVAERLKCPLRRAKRCLKAYNASEDANENN